MAASVHKLQLVHSATSMIMFHFFMTLSPRYFAGTSGAGLRRTRGFFAAALLCAAPAKAAEMNAVLPSHGTTSTSALAPASECVVLVCVRSGVSRLRQPPRSTDRPGSPIGSYIAEDS